MTDKDKQKSKMVFEYKLTVNGEVKLDKPVRVRRESELNGIIMNYNLDVGDEVVIKAKRVV